MYIIAYLITFDNVTANWYAVRTIFDDINDAEEWRLGLQGADGRILESRVIPIPRLV